MRSEQIALLARWTKAHVRRTSLLGLALLLAVVAYLWITFRQREPAILTYCTKYSEAESRDKDSSRSHRCIETKTLKIPAIYYGAITNAAREDASQTQRIEVAYPSMQAWASVPWFERSNAQKIEIQLDGRTLQTVEESFSNYFLGTPKPIHMPQPLFGLDRYDDGGTLGMYLLPLERNPRVHIFCGVRGVVQDAKKGFCRNITYTNWQLKVIYYQPQILLSQWADIHTKVHVLIQSFVVAL